MPSTTRRGLLRALPALAVGLAGCSTLDRDDDEPPIDAMWQYDRREPQSTALAAEDTLVVGDGGPFPDDPLVAGFDPATGERLWEVTTGKGEKSPVTADENRAYAYSKAGELLAVDHAAGETDWRQSVTPVDDADPGVTEFAPLRSGDQVLVPISGTEDDVPDRLLGFSTDGDPAFTQSFDRSLSGAPAAARGGAVVPLLDGRLVRVEADGTRAWTQTLDGSLSAVTVADGMVYVGSATEDLLALSLTDGSVQWRTPLSNTVFTRPLVAEGTVYVGGADYRLRAVDAETGIQRWQRELSNAVTHGPFRAGGRLLTLVGGKRRVRGRSGTVPFEPTELFVHRPDGSLVTRTKFDGYPNGGPVEWLDVAGDGVYLGQAFGLTRVSEEVLND